MNMHSLSRHSWGHDAVVAWACVAVFLVFYPTFPPVAAWREILSDSIAAMTAGYAILATVKWARLR